MKPFYFILFVIAFFSACKKEKINISVGPYIPIQISCKFSNNIDSLKDQIQGTWEWKQEKQAPRDHPEPIYLTPQTENYALQLIFSKDGYARYYKNSKLTSEQKYKIQPLSYISFVPEDSIAILVYYTPNNLIQNFVPIGLCNNYLVLHYDYISDIVGEFTFIKK